MEKVKNGMELIAEERQRQIDVEGHTPEHDKRYENGELFNAACCYSYAESVRTTNNGEYYFPELWPWGKESWKPSPENPIREKVKAGALFMAHQEATGIDCSDFIKECAQKIDRLIITESDDLEQCEGCEAISNDMTHDSEGVPLCSECYDGMMAAVAEYTCKECGAKGVDVDWYSDDLCNPCEDKPTFVIVNDTGFLTINGLRVTFADKKIREDIELHAKLIGDDFTLPKKYKVEKFPGCNGEDVSKIGYSKPVKSCYIAGKISGLPLPEVDAKFSAAETKVEELGYLPVNPRTLTHDHSKSWQSYMRADIAAMLKCDAVYALGDWRDSPGATIEVNLANSLGMEIVYEDEPISE